MGCDTCANGSKNKTPKGCKNNGHCSVDGCGKLDTYDWLSNIYYIDDENRPEYLEVKYKGTRKGFFKNTYKLDLQIGDQVVTECHTGGYDIGFVSLRGELVKLQMKKYNVEEDHNEMLNVMRKANERDVEKWESIKNKEYPTMIKARQLAVEIGLVMKVSDVEYQGDGSKAIFYYTADGRVDFRELIKVLASTFKLKIEMKQLGLRQEAGRLGGIGSCGRELCCSTWLTDFSTVSTSAARYQNLFINPQKLAGQCGRLKCCLNYELDTYLEAIEEFPNENSKVKTAKGIAVIDKMDILKKQIWLKYEAEKIPELFCVSVDKFNEMLKNEKEGNFAQSLTEVSFVEKNKPENEHDYKNVVEESNLNRFDNVNKKKRSGRNKKRNPNQNPNRNQK